MLGQATIVTTSVNHNYVVGQEVRLLIPQGYGCTQLNEKTGFVTAILAANEVLITIDSTNANNFINASLSQQPQILAIGDINSGPINSNGPSQEITFIPGSFINVSPN
jgi:hypothetical protein